MKIVIIEDERVTAEDLQATIGQVDAALEILVVLKSVSEGLEWFSSNPAPDLIFSDIHLGDGLSFEILSRVRTPVIFCTAYDEYALNAFRTNGIDYILKPFTLNSVSAALEKFKNLTQIKQEDILRQYESIRNLFSETRKVKNASLLIHYKDAIIPVSGSL